MFREIMYVYSSSNNVDHFMLKITIIKSKTIHTFSPCSMLVIEKKTGPKGPKAKFQKNVCNTYQNAAMSILELLTIHFWGQGSLKKKKLFCSLFSILFYTKYFKMNKYCPPPFLCFINYYLVYFPFKYVVFFQFTKLWQGLASPFSCKLQPALPQVGKGSCGPINIKASF